MLTALERSQLSSTIRRGPRMIKVVAPNMAQKIIDRAIQVCGGAGVSQDFHLAYAWARTRVLRLADGPDEVHRETIAKQELRKYLSNANRKRHDKSSAMTSDGNQG